MGPSPDDGEDGADGAAGSDRNPRDRPEGGHGHDARQRVRCAVLTVSDSRTLTTDRAGPAIASVLKAAAHEVVSRQVVPDDVDAIGAALEALSDQAEVVFVTGGTGPAPSDVTPEAVRPLAVKELPGFGEAFRRASREEIGAAAMLSRAFAAVVPAEPAPVAVFCLPGSPSGAKLGAEMVAGELGHLVALLGSGGDDGPG